MASGDYGSMDGGEAAGGGAGMVLDGDDDDGALGEGAADGSQITRVVDNIYIYDDGYKWRK